jgi:hypothetical protein
MIDKYYTPEISEFHVGFEYELSSNIFPHMPVRLTWTSQNFIGYEDVSTIESFIEEKFVRVRMLNEDDILDLGWEKGEQSQFPRENQIVYRIKDEKAEETCWFTLVFIQETGLIKVEKRTTGMLDDEWGETLIRNKSELKVFMRQIGL